MFLWGICLDKWGITYLLWRYVVKSGFLCRNDKGSLIFVSRY